MTVLEGRPTLAQAAPLTQDRAGRCMLAPAARCMQVQVVARMPVPVALRTRGPVVVHTPDQVVPVTPDLAVAHMPAQAAPLMQGQVARAERVNSASSLDRDVLDQVQTSTRHVTSRPVTVPTLVSPSSSAHTRPARSASSSVPASRA